MAHLQNYKIGPQAELSQKLLNEIAHPPQNSPAAASASPRRGLGSRLMRLGTKPLKSLLAGSRHSYW